jgi:hypothetical protein
MFHYYLLTGWNSLLLLVMISVYYNLTENKKLGFINNGAFNICLLLFIISIVLIIKLFFVIINLLRFI